MNGLSLIWSKGEVTLTKTLNTEVKDIEPQDRTQYSTSTVIQLHFLCSDKSMENNIIIDVINILTTGLVLNKLLDIEKQLCFIFLLNASQL